MIQINIWILIGLMGLFLIAGLTIAAIADRTIGKQTKIDLIQNWLKYMVILAERKFGSGTGKLKFTYVYNKFIEKWPDIATLVSEAEFNDLVQVAIEKMEQLRNNEAINNFINNFGLTELEESDYED